MDIPSKAAKRIIQASLWLLCFSASAVAQVSFSTSAGFYSNGTPVVLNAPAGQNIRYTIDGDIPTINSTLYTAPLRLTEELFSSRNIYLIPCTPTELWNPPQYVEHAVLIRAAAFDEGGNRIGNIATHTYIIRDTPPPLPVVSISIRPEDLFDADSGIFSPTGFNPDDDFTTGNFNMHGREWERVANIEFIDTSYTGFNLTAGLRVHGGKTRRNMQKPLKIYARNEYGQKSINYPLFPSLPYQKFKRLVLKPFSASWNTAGLSDALAQHIAEPLRFITLATRPVSLYINGEYWGIYYLQEAPDEHLIETHEGVDNDDVTIIGSWLGLVENGNNTLFNEMMQTLDNADFSDSLQYQNFCSLIDIDNFIDYILFEAFITNDDWPANNMRCYHYTDAPWRWIFYDGDAAFLNPEKNMTIPMLYNGNDLWPSCFQCTLMWRQLLRSPLFVERASRRLKHLSQTTFASSNTLALLNDEYDAVADDIWRQIHRFSIPGSHDEWKYDIGNTRDFLSRRPDIYLNEMASMLGISTSDKLQVFPNPAHGTIWISTNDNTTGWIYCTIYDIQGRIVSSKPVLLNNMNNKESIDISHLSAGLYNVTLGNNSIRLIVY